MKTKETWQRGNRLSKVHAQELVNLYRSHIAVEVLRANELLNINRAHALMLYRTNIISRTDASQILRTLDILGKKGIEREIHVDPRIGDLSTHMESYIISRVGEHVGGKIHTGRSRNDLYSTLNKMVARRQTLEIYGAVTSLINTLLSEAPKYRDAVMPGYTHHSQHAQPITFGYFLVGAAEVFFRDLIRLEDAYTTINKSPMGAAAIATTGFQLDRKLVSKLLGFEGISEHGYDAVSSKDFLLDFLYAQAVIASDLGRLAESLLLWNTFEFNLIELSDEFCSFSTIMPQKKNPVSLETIRAFNPIVTGKLMNAFNILKAEPWSNGRETIILDDETVEIADILKGLLLLMNAIIKKIEINRPRMYELALHGFSTATELADSIVRAKGLSFREAHEIVGLTIRKVIDSGLDATSISSKRLDDSSQEIIGRPLMMDERIIKNSLDPKKNVELRTIVGGTARQEMLRMVYSRKRMLADKERKLKKYQNKLIQSLNMLDREAKGIIKSR